MEFNKKKLKQKNEAFAAYTQYESASYNNSKLNGNSNILESLKDSVQHGYSLELSLRIMLAYI